MNWRPPLGAMMVKIRLGTYVLVAVQSLDTKIARQ
jgi:hypothetical protein